MSLFISDSHIPKSYTYIYDYQSNPEPDKMSTMDASATVV